MLEVRKDKKNDVEVAYHKKGGGLGMLMLVVGAVVAGLVLKELLNL